MNVAKALVYRFVVSMLEDPEAQRELLEELRVRPESTQHPLDERVPVSTLNAAHRRLAEITGDSFVSWRFGYLFELDSIGVLGLLWRHASNLEDMVALHVKFLGVLLDVANAELVPVDGGKKVEWTPLPSWESDDPLGVQREFEAAMRARNLDAVCAPTVVDELVRDKVLVTEWVDGTRLDLDARQVEPFFLSAICLSVALLPSTL